MGPSQLSFEGPDGQTRSLGVARSFAEKRGQ